MNETTMGIGEVARRSGVAPSALRYYESIGILPEPERVAGRRRYTVDVLRRLAIIDVCQRAGFTLTDVAELLAGADGGDAGTEMQSLAAHKLPQIEALIQRAEAVKRWLEVASACECSTLDVCALFDDRALDLPPEITPGPPGLAVLNVAPAASRGA
jgi:MerR family transcriptional regulator, redox-sensitive transcriptional activator SoxR